jgi:hypothetical protein
VQVGGRERYMGKDIQRVVPGRKAMVHRIGARNAELLQARAQACEVW